MAGIPILDLSDSTVISAMSLYPQSTTGVVNGVGVDFSPADLTVSALCELGTIINAGAANTVQFSFQEAVDNATWTNIADPRAVLGGGLSNTGMAQIATFNRTKRYVRGVVTGGPGYQNFVSILLLSQQRFTNPAPGYSYSPQV